MDASTKSIGPACKRYESLLDDYLSDLLDAASANRVEAHLLNCANCRDALEAARVGAHFLRAASLNLDRVRVVGPQFPRMVMARISAEKDRRSAERLSFWQPFVTFAWRFAATAVVAFVILLTYAVRGRGRSRQVVGPIGQSQLVDVLAPDPTTAPANQDEVLILMAESNHANH